MIGKPKESLEQYDDLTLLLKYLNLAEEYEKVVDVPIFRAAEIDTAKMNKVNFQQLQVLEECMKRNLMHPWHGLTEKAIKLRPWAHESVKGKWHNWIQYLVDEECEKTGKAWQEVWAKMKPELTFSR